MSPGHVLVVEDEPSIADNVSIALERDGFIVTTCALGSDAVARVRSTAFDIVILDIGLPDISGIDVCREIRSLNRSQGDVPILFLTARDSEIDRVVGLELGADDYVTKPFSPRELAARVRAILRRTGSQGTVSKAGGNPPPLLLLDPHRRQVTVLGEAVTLTRYEFGILAVLMRRPGHVLTREQLLTAVWSDPGDTSDRVIDTHIKTLRAKLAAAGHLVRTHRGIGYSIDEPSSDEPSSDEPSSDEPGEG